MFAVAAAALLRRERPKARDWYGAASVCAGVILVVLLRGEVTQVAPPRDQVGRAVAGTVVLIAAILVLARGALPAHLRSALVAVGAGIAFCTTAILIVVVTGDLARYGPIGAVSWPVPALALSAVVGSLLVQDSFAGGSLPVALTAMTVTDPLASGVAGVLLFDAARPGPATLVGLAGAAVLIGLGVGVVANSGALTDDRSAQPSPADAT
jgi:hypothetical protein